MEGKPIAADHKLTLRKRGICCSNDSRWHEIDYLITTKTLAGRCSKLQAVAVGETDRMAKILHFRLAKGEQVTNRTKWRPPVIPTSGFDAAKLKEKGVQKLNADKMHEVITEDMSWAEALPRVQEISKGI